MVSDTVFAAILAGLSGILTFLWHEIQKERQNRKDVSERHTTEIQSLQARINKVFIKVFGADHDATDAGYVQETDEEIESLNDRFDRLDEKIDQVEQRRIKEHEKVIEKLDEALNEKNN